MPAGWGLVALLVAVFPVHVHMVMNPQLYPSVPLVALWLRLLLQGPLIAWAYWYTRPATSPASRAQGSSPAFTGTTT